MSLGLTKLGGRVRDIIFALIVGLVVACIAYSFFYVVPVDSAGLSSASPKYTTHYIDGLSDAWKVLAAWIPIMMVCLSLIISNSNKRLFKILGRTGNIAFIVDDIAISTIFLLLAIVALFIHNVLTPPPAYWTFICTALVIVAIYYFGVVFRIILILAKVNSESAELSN